MSDTGPDDKHSAKAKIVQASFALKDKLGGAGINIRQLLGDDKVASADMTIRHTIAQEKENYPLKAAKDLTELDAIHQALQANTMDAKKALARIEEIALDFKTNAALFGYPIAAKIAVSLHSLCGQIKEFDPKILVVFKAHIDTIGTVFSRDTNHKISPEALQLLKRLTNEKK